MGRHLDGCRIGFDIGGSDRKAAALIDGKVVFSEETPWDPYFQKDPSYHIEGINDSLKRAAAHLPRVDAIGGSAAGIYVNNEVRVASLFRGIPAEVFETDIRKLFFTLQARWGGIPFEVANDGEVAALAGSMALGDNAVLGISMGTSQAGGYVKPGGEITPWLNELAFAPVDYRKGAPVDEWSGDAGCGVQYFSQQAVARLADKAGFTFDAGMPAPERLVAVQAGDGGRRQARRAGLRLGGLLPRLFDRPLLRLLPPEARPRHGPRHLRPRRREDHPQGAGRTRLRVPGGGLAHPRPHARREGQAARPGHRRGKPSLNS
jgi:predicted NBD/HSP70 family sugar kinase